MPTALVSGWSRPAPMSAKTYKDLCSLIHQHSRIHLPPSKHTLLSSRLGKRLRELRLNSWEDYLNWLYDHPDKELENLIDLVSTNHTHFFRENEHFDKVSTQLLNELLQHSPTAREKLHCWSAASSSGEEAFTLAIVLSEYAEQKPGGLRWQIDGTDISGRAIQLARQAVYPIHRLGLPQPSLLHKYFQKGCGPFEGYCQVKNELRNKVHFHRMNLFDKVYRIPAMQHVIFCRNALIYFDHASQAQLIERLHDVLEPGGYLIVGHSESLLRIRHPFKVLGNSIYQRQK
jgi:chemotaxis protein methyltransferase CheR